MPTLDLGPFRFTGPDQELGWCKEWFRDSTFPWSRITKRITIEHRPAAEMPPFPGGGPSHGYAYYTQDKVAVLLGIPKNEHQYVLGHETGHVPLDSSYLTWSMRTALREVMGKPARGWSETPYESMPAEVYAHFCALYLTSNPPQDPYHIYQPPTLPAGRIGDFLNVLFTPPDYAALQKALPIARANLDTTKAERDAAQLQAIALQAEVTRLNQALADCQASGGGDCSEQEATIARLVEELRVCRDLNIAKDAAITSYRGSLLRIQTEASEALQEAA